MRGRHYAIIVLRETAGYYRAVQPDLDVSVTRRNLDACLRAARRAITSAVFVRTARGLVPPKAIPLNEFARTGLAEGALVVSIELPEYPRVGGPGGQQALPADMRTLAAELRPFVGIRLSALREAFIEATVEACDGNVVRAARLLGVHNSTVYRERKQHRKRATKH